MATQLWHRGPDDDGIWIDAGVGVALGHRRLAILDLSPEGHQPMHSADGRYVLVFNGEIYNFQALRRELEARGCSFRGHSDTEIMLAAFSEWGLDTALKRFVGMFALGLWDRHQRTLHLARDRMGEKPLYYGWSNGVFLFGSEIKALRAHSKWHGELDPGALAGYLSFGCVPSPLSMYRGIYKLPPGCSLSLSQPEATRWRLPQPRVYWSLAEVAAAGVHQPIGCSEAEATDQLERLLTESIAQQMVADVPVGAFLSGGIDSSTIAGLMQAHSARAIKTFSIGFEEDKYDEAQSARKVAHHLGTEHTELYVGTKELAEVVDRLPTIYDEPFSDSSQIPTVLLCRLARQQVTVSLSGDGGDELFGGYQHYGRAERLWQCRRLLPGTVRTEFGRATHRLLSTRLAATLPPGRLRVALNRLSNLSARMQASSDFALYCSLLYSCTAPQDLLRQSPLQTPFLAGRSLWDALPGFLERMMCLDSASYLPDDILVKVDRAAMSVSLETRIPLLDHRVIEFAWKLPRSYKVRNGCGKWLLRQVLYRYVPRQLVERPKQGFGVPLATWLRGPLREYSDNLLNPTRLRQEGIFDEAVISRRRKEHLLEIRDWSQSIWQLMMFQAWLERQHPVSKPEELVPSEPATNRGNLELWRI